VRNQTKSDQIRQKWAKSYVIVTYQLKRGEIGPK